MAVMTLHYHIVDLLLKPLGDGLAKKYKTIEQLNEVLEKCILVHGIQ